ncbi:MAG: hypothetical protein ACI9JZ_002079, partial [Lentimonas sp.]
KVAIRGTRFDHSRSQEPKWWRTLLCDCVLHSLKSDAGSTERVIGEARKM